MRGDFFHSGGVFFIWLLLVCSVYLEFFISSRLLYKYLDEYLGSGVISKVDFG